MKILKIAAVSVILALGMSSLAMAKGATTHGPGVVRYLGGVSKNAAAAVSCSDAVTALCFVNYTGQTFYLSVPALQIYGAPIPPSPPITEASADYVVDNPYNPGFINVTVRDGSGEVIFQPGGGMLNHSTAEFDPYAALNSKGSKKVLVRVRTP